MMEEIKRQKKTIMRSLTQDGRGRKYNEKWERVCEGMVHRLIELVEEEQVKRCDIALIKIRGLTQYDTLWLESAPRVSDALKAEETP